MKIIHAHLKYIWNKSTKNLKETLKALGGVDFTKYALPTIIVYQRTIGPENAHLKPDPAVLSHHEMTLTLNTHTPLLNS